MTIYGIEFTWTIGDYRFAVGYDSGGGCGLDERIIECRQRVNGGWTDSSYLRSYYFEEVQRPAMRNFCQKFATNQQYRADCLARTTDWAVRNQLFERNNSAMAMVPPTIARVHRSIGDAHETWRFIKRHWQAIVARPEYQQVAALDGVFTPTFHELDPKIRLAVEAFNRTAGVETLFSCQGVTATVAYESYDILVVSPHERFAYVRFKHLPLEVAERLDRLTRACGLASLHNLTLYSTGDNLAFRKEAVRLADELQQEIVL